MLIIQENLDNVEEILVSLNIFPTEIIKNIFIAVLLERGSSTKC